MLAAAKLANYLMQAPSIILVSVLVFHPSLGQCEAGMAAAKLANYLKQAPSFNPCVVCSNSTPGECYAMVTHQVPAWLVPILP